MRDATFKTCEKLKKIIITRATKRLLAERELARSLNVSRSVLRESTGLYHIQIFEGIAEKDIRKAREALDRVIESDIREAETLRSHETTTVGE